MRILIGLPEGGLAQRLGQMLAQAGHAADPVGDEPALCAALALVPYELALVHLGLGRPPGPGLVRRLRTHAPGVPLLALASGSSVQERISALDHGADDCLPEPVVADELLARVRAWARRGMGSALNQIRHGPLQLNTAERTVQLSGRPLPLSRREISLLEILMRRRGRFVSKDHMLEMMFGWGEEVSANTIEVYVHRLRKKIEVGPVRILSSRGVGYQLAAIEQPAGA